MAPNADDERIARMRQDDPAARLIAIGERVAMRIRLVGKPIDHDRLLYDERGRPARR